MAAASTTGGVSVVVFAHKGGSGKTTTTIQLAAALANKRKKVCVLDCDGQLNATQYFVEDNDAQDCEDHQYSALVKQCVEVDLLQTVAGAGAGATGAVEPLFPGDDLDEATNGYTMDAFSKGTKDGKNLKTWYDMIFKHNSKEALHNWLQPGADKAGHVLHEVTNPDYGGNLWYVKGSVNLSLYDECVSKACSDDAKHLADQLTRMRRGLPHKILHELKHAHGFDFILVDLSPACSAMNKAWVMSSDFFLPPVDPSAFGATGCETLLSEVLPRWFEWHSAVAQAEHAERTKGLEEGDPGNAWTGDINAGLCMRSEPPHILPLMFNKYDVATTGNVFFNHSNFIATTRHYVAQRFEDREKLKPFERRVLDRMVAWRGHHIMAVIPKVDAIPTSESLGLPVVSLQDDGKDYLENFQFEVVDEVVETPRQRTPVNKRKRNPKKRKASTAGGSGAGGSAAAAAAASGGGASGVSAQKRSKIGAWQFEEYKKDLVVLKSRYNALADFLIYRRAVANGGASAASAAAAPAASAVAPADEGPKGLYDII